MKALIWLMAAGLSFAETTPDLPAWSEDDRKALEGGEFVPGAALLEEEAGEGEFPPVDMSLPTEAEEPVETVVPEQHWDAYFGEKPSSFLIDPQGLLGAEVVRDREEFLKYHADDSEVDLYVYLFEAGQEIPPEVRKEEMAERFFPEGKPAVIVHYFLGAPERSVLYLSPLLIGEVSPVEQRRALSSAVEEAMEKSGAVAQFEAFCVQLSVRVYWMERAAGLVSEPASAIMPRRPKADRAAVKTEPEVIALAKEWARRHGPVAGGATGALLAAAGVLAFARRRARHRFPVFEISPRLGGDHAAGIGAVISFGSTMQSPSSQKNDLPDYLGL